jgi:acetyltransferase-like isoleucine patch superfamily enzyme
MNDGVGPANLRQAVEWSLATPWKAVTELRRLAAWPWIRFYFALHGVAWGARWHAYGCPIIQLHRGSSITIGDDFWIRSWRTSNPLGVNHPCILTTWSAGAVIKIGDGVSVTGGAICAEKGVRIGDRVIIGANCTIIDSDFHPLGPAQRKLHPSAGAAAPVTIDDDAFIGTGVLILKGSHIGQGAVVGAGSVVAGDIPAHAVVAGNPARVIREP